MSMLTRTKKWEKPKLFILGITALCAYSLFVDLKGINRVLFKKRAGVFYQV